MVRMKLNLKSLTVSRGASKAAVVVFGGLLPFSAFGVDFTSVTDGDWSTVTTWSPNGNPNTGEFQGVGGADNVTVNGHDVTVDQDTYGGSGAVTPRFTIKNGNTLTINGGSVETAGGDGSMLVGEANSGNLVINNGGTFRYNGAGAGYIGFDPGGNGSVAVNDGTFHFNTSNTSGILAVGRGGGNGSATIGDNVGAPGTAIWNNDGRLFSVGGDSGAGTGTVNINSDGTVLNARIAVGHANGSVGTMNLNGTGQYQTTTGTSLNYVGVNGGSTGTLNLNDNSTFTWRGSRAFRVGSNNTTEGTVNIRDNATLIGTGGQGGSTDGFIVGYAGQGVLNISGNATVNLGSSILAGSQTNGDGWVNQTGGSVSAQNVFMGRNGTSQGTYTISGGTLDVSNRIGPGLTGDGQFIQNGGTVTTPRINFSEAGAGAGTYTLAGGTLRTDIIDMNFGDNADPDGVFVWGNGTLTMRQVNAGSAGGTDYSTAVVTGGVGPVVRSGTTIAVDGNLLTGDSGGDSVLDLGGLYLNGGTRQDILDIDGSLALTGDDTLISIGTPKLLRPSGGNSIDFGTIPLITTTGGITGSFDDIVLPGPDSRNFFLSPFAVSDPSLLKPNSFYFEQTGTELLFHYKVSGAIPEPATVSFIAFGMIMLRFSRWAFGINKTK